jgi:undecaprenyl-diphosphatase
MGTLYMLSTIDSIILGIVQGLTEFLPISSSGHLIIARELLNIEQTGGLAFDAILQLATACTVLLYFRKDIWDLVLNVFKKIRDPQKTKLTLALVIGTIPAIIFGLLLQDYMDTVFRNPALVSLTLIIGAGIMFYADKVLEKRTVPAENLTFKKGLIVGLFQALALVPGMSRSGMSISGGYFLGLSKETAVRFSFLLSIPIIVGSGLLKVKDIIQDPSLIGGQYTTLILGAITAFVFGWFAIDFLLKFLKTNSFKGFVIYRIVLASLLMLFVLF